MPKLLNLRGVTLAGLSIAALVLSGCAKKDYDHGNGAPMPDNGDQVNVNGGGLPLAPRPPEGFDPNRDVDYQTLAADTIYFAFDSSVIPPGERPKLSTVEEWLKANPDRTLFLAGNADKRGTPEYNRALGERRADSVREYLIGLGANMAQLQTISYGSDRPVATGDTEEDYAKNRRVDVGVMQQGAGVPPPSTPVQ